MNGYGSHTYMWVNAAGERFWVKYHFKTDQGIEFFTQDEADQMAALDAEDADHAVRGGQDLPVQPVRPDQGVAARRLPADRGRPADPGPQPDRLPLRDGAGGVRAEQPGARHRAEPGQDAAGPRVLLRRRAPRPAWRELQADPGERAEGPGAQLQQGLGYAGGEHLGPRLRTELQGWPAGRLRPLPAAQLALGRGYGPCGLHAAHGGRRLGLGGARWSGRFSTTRHGSDWPATSSGTCSTE